MDSVIVLLKKIENDPIGEMNSLPSAIKHLMLLLEEEESDPTKPV